MTTSSRITFNANAYEALLKAIIRQNESLKEMMNSVGEAAQSAAAKDNEIARALTRHAEMAQQTAAAFMEQAQVAKSLLAAQTQCVSSLREFIDSRTSLV